MMRNYWVLKNKVTDLTPTELLQETDRIIEEGRREIIYNTNVHGIILARRHEWLLRLRNQARIVHCDGAGVAIGGRLLGLPMRRRVSMNDLIWPFADHWRAHQHSIYLLGATANIVAGAAATLRDEFPGIRIAGYDSGYFNINSSENDAVIERINESRPNILLIGMGMPLQEAWAAAHIQRLNVNVIMLVGGQFKRLSGAIPFAPAWVSAWGLEWAYLSLRDPRRFFQRYLHENPWFMTLILLQRFGLISSRPEVGDAKGLGDGASNLVFENLISGDPKVRRSSTRGVRH